MTARDWRGMAAALSAVWCLAAAAADPATPGAYCPIPEPGAPRGCLEPAEQQYAEFFDAVDAGRTDDAEFAGVEAAVASGAGEAEGYLALSSLAYGYYQLSRAAARTPNADPAIAARLERWNELLGRVYGEDPDAEPWRGAVREAARDLERRAPPVELACRGAAGQQVPCTSTDAMLQRLELTASAIGFRGGLERVFRRWFGADES